MKIRETKYDTWHPSRSLAQFRGRVWRSEPRGRLSAYRELLVKKPERGGFLARLVQLLQECRSV